MKKWIAYIAIVVVAFGFSWFIQNIVIEMLFPTIWAHLITAIGIGIVFGIIFLITGEYFNRKNPLR